MTRKELRQRVERLLQDADNKRWSDSEINGYLDDAQLDFCRIAKNPKTSVTQNLVDVTKRYTGASLSVSSKTVTVTLGGSDTHTLSEGSSVLISGVPLTRETEDMLSFLQHLALIPLSIFLITLILVLSLILSFKRLAQSSANLPQYLK